MVYFFLTCMCNNNNITHSSHSSVTSFGYPDPIPVFVSMWGSPHTYLHQAILEQQGVGKLSSILMISAQRQCQIPRLRALFCKIALHPHTPDASRKLQAVPCASDLPATDWRFQRPPPYDRLICLSGSQNSEKHLTLTIIKATS